MNRSSEQEFWKTIECPNWEKFVTQVHKEAPPVGWAFRGELATDDLKSSLERSLPAHLEGQERRKRELFIIREFMRRAHHFLGPAHIPDHKNTLEWLSMMRHYGGPSRLIDFTYSPFIAAYFALKRMAGEKPGVVWAIDLDWAKHALPKKPKGLLEPQRIGNTLLGETPVGRGIVHVNPVRLNERLTQQQGLFFCTLDWQDTFREALSLQYENTPPKDKRAIVLQFQFSGKFDRGVALRALRQMNIHSATLYPDLGGFAESLNDLLYLKDHIFPNDDKLKSVYTGDDLK